ncbi:MAG: hypothetical protein K8T90_22575 [Planctomycetes bacterium]|nr:hypothetical protein [Planctomycetota bacterium]
MRPTLTHAVDLTAVADAIAATARRLSGAVTLAALMFCLAVAGCATTTKGGESAPPPSSASSSASSQPDDTPAGPSAGSKVGGYVLAVPENIVWLPWKVIGGGFKGASDGVQAGFAKGRMPALGALFSPVNLVVGFVSGMVEGGAMSPGLIGPSDNFSRVMASPTKRSMNVWWYP